MAPREEHRGRSHLGQRVERWPRFIEARPRVVREGAEARGHLDDDLRASDEANERPVCLRREEARREVVEGDGLQRGARVFERIGGEREEPHSLGPRAAVDAQAPRGAVKATVDGQREAFGEEARVRSAGEPPDVQRGALGQGARGLSMMRRDVVDVGGSVGHRGPSEAIIAMRENGGERTW